MTFRFLVNHFGQESYESEEKEEVKISVCFPHPACEWD